MDANLSRFLVGSQRWMRLITEPVSYARPAIFLDRDGVMIEEREYLCDPAGVALIPGCSAFVQRAQQHGFAVVVVSNQSGIGRGYFGWCEHDRIERRVIELLASEHAAVDAMLANSATDDAVSGHGWRKPQPGMLIAAAHALKLDLALSVIVGDKASDLAAGRAASLARGVHVLTGHGGTERQEAKSLSTGSFAVTCADSIADVNMEDYRTT